MINKTIPPGEGAKGWDQYMRSGQFAEAWTISDAELARRKGIPCWHLPRHFQYIWNGEPLAGKRVLVRCYHGLGDTLQFIRYIPLLQMEAAEVMVWVQARLIPLFQYLSFPVELFPLHDGTPEVTYDLDIELMELPHYFRTTLLTIPQNVPYLDVPPAVLPDSGKACAIGLVWRSGDWDESRWVPFSLIRQLANVANTRFFILQADAKSAGWDGVTGTMAGGSDILADAQVIRALDLVICVDTMVAHLAGALGVKVWTLLPYQADWRWMDGKSDSPWYPSMRLFRQKDAGQWEPVVERVKKELAAFAASVQG